MKSPLQNNAHKQKFNPNYYPSVASVDSSSIESTCMFPETLNKMHNRMCDRKNKNSKSTNMQSNSPPKLDTSKTMLTQS